MQKNIQIVHILATVVIVILFGVSFYGGMKYSQSKKGNFAQDFGRFQQTGSGGMGVNRNSGGGFINGEIISKDDKSITLKDKTGGSKIIFFSDTTEISKFASGSKEDLVVGQAVMIAGKTNSDGSVTAQTIQVRPGIPNTQASPK